MAENEATHSIRKVAFAQSYIKEKYSDTIGLATSILGQVLLGTIRGSKRKKEVIKLCLKDMKNEFSDRVAEDPRKEIEFMTRICNRNHPNFVGFIDAVEDNKLYCICLEYVIGGDMCTYIQNIGQGINNTRAQKYAIQLTKAVYFMHQNGYCHLDLSLENVLWDKRNDMLKICDFGLCRKFVNNDPTQSFAAATIRPGKKGYMAPEIYAYQKFNGEKADVFSLGVIIFILLTGFPPFNTPNASDKCFQFMYYGKLEWLLGQWKLNDIIPKECRDLLSRIFCHPKKRITVKEMLSHAYLNQNMYDIEKEMKSYTNENNNHAINTAVEIVNTVNEEGNDKKSNVNINTVAGPVVKKKRKSVSRIIKKRKSVSKISKHKRKESTNSKRKSTNEKRAKVNNNDDHDNHKRARRAKSKSIAHLSICESQTLLSEFAGAATGAKATHAHAIATHVYSDDNYEKNKNKNNKKKTRSKSLCYSYDNRMNTLNLSELITKNYHINNNEMSDNNNNNNQNKKNNVTQKIDSNKRPSNQHTHNHNNPLREQSPANSERSHSHSHSHSSDDHKSKDENQSKAINIENNIAEIANLRQHLNETQLITQKYKKNNNNGNFTPNANDYGMDNDRKEGDYETYPHVNMVHEGTNSQERKYSINSQDAGSVNSDQSHQALIDEDNNQNANAPNNNNQKPHAQANQNNNNTSQAHHNHTPV